MGNDPGKKLDSDAEKSRVVIDITGPFKAQDAEAFKKDLLALLDKHKVKWGKHDLPVKKPGA